jgi:hypothetical protein
MPSNVVPLPAGYAASAHRALARLEVQRYRDRVLSPFAKEKESKRNTACAVGIGTIAVMVIFFFSLWTNPKRKEAREKDLVRMRGLEPPRLAPLPPQSSVSTSSTTSAPKTAVDRRGAIDSSAAVPAARSLLRRSLH